MFFKGKKQKAGLGLKDANQTLLALDIGSSKVRLIAGKVDTDGQVDVEGYEDLRSRGVTKGAVTDINLLSSNLAELIGSFTEKYNLEPRHFIVGVPGQFIRSYSKNGTATCQSGVVTIADRNHAVENARAGVKFDMDYESIHVIPNYYITPTSSDVRNPIGQYAGRIDVNCHIVACMSSHMRNLEHVVDMISPDFQITDFSYDGIAASDAVLSAGEKEIGVCLIDIGGGTVSVTVYDNNNVVMTFGFDGGGDAITQAVAKQFGIPMDTAEDIKVKYGYADTDLSAPQNAADGYLQIPVTDPYYEDRNHVVNIAFWELAAQIRTCLGDIFQMIGNRINQYVSENRITLNLGAGFVLTGGVANTPGIDRVLEVELIQRSATYSQLGGQSKVRLGYPRGVRKAADQEPMRLKPDYANVVGLLRCGYSHLIDSYATRDPAEQQEGRSTFSRFVDWISREL